MTCPLCGAEDTRPLFTAWDRNRQVSAQRFAYRRCGSCGSVFLATPPIDLGRYYPEDYYQLPGSRALDLAGAQERYKLDFIVPYAQGDRLVEIGPGAGAFARLATRHGFAVTGIEMDSRSCRHLETVVGIETVQSALPAQALAELPPSDVIALWHSLEHLPNPWEVVESAGSNLVAGGLLVVATPNPSSLQFRLLGARWPHLDAPRHLFLLPAEALVQRAAAAGFIEVTRTSSDPGGRAWNRFGWGHTLAPPSAGRYARAFARLAGTAVAGLFGPLEQRALRGATYTVVLRKLA